MAWLLAFLPLFLVCTSAAGGRQLLEAPSAGSPVGMLEQAMGQGIAPAPAPVQPEANILFTISAVRATLTGDSLELARVAPVVLFMTTGSMTGVYPTGEFANSSAGAKFVTAEGEWLDSPVAVFKATDSKGKPVTALLALAEPRYENLERKLTFKTKVLPATREGARLPTVGGATDRLVEDASQGLRSGVLTAPPADPQLTEAALFIDQNSEALREVSEAEYLVWVWRRRWWWWGK